MFCLQMHAHAGRTMNEKLFRILHSAAPRAVLKISSHLLVLSVYLRQNTSVLIVMMDVIVVTSHVDGQNRNDI